MKLLRNIILFSIFFLFSSGLAAEEKEDKPSLDGDPFAKKKEGKKEEQEEDTVRSRYDAYLYKSKTTEEDKKEEKKDDKKAEKKEDKKETKKAEVKKEVKKEPEKEKDVESRKNYFSLAVLGNMTVPTGNADPTWAVHARIHYIFPFWNPHLSFGVEAGYYTLKGKGSSLDPEAGLYDYSWKVDTMPLFVGLGFEYPIIKKIFYINTGAGFATVFAWSEGKSFGGTTKTSDIAYGWYAGLGAEIRFGIFGGIAVEARYNGMLLDFDYPNYNKENGDIGGLNVLLGYKYTY